MNKRSFYLLAFSLILAFAFLLRIIPALNHNFFFTEDQGGDSLQVREILSGRLVFLGPETTIRGLFAGPLWHYFIAFGYFLFSGDPFGGVFMMILLNVMLIGILMWIVARKVGAAEALILGFFLQIFWWFYDTSRWAFNPFPLVALAIILLLLLVEVLKGKEKKYLAGLVPVLLAFNVNIAGAIALYLFYLVLGIGLVFRSRLKKEIFFVSLVIPAVGMLFFGRQAAGLVERTWGAGVAGGGVGVFSGVSYWALATEFFKIVSYATIPQYGVLGVIFLTFLLFYLFSKTKNDFSKHFVLLTLVLFAVSYLFFGSTQGWRDWQTVYIPTVLFVSVMLMVFSLQGKIKIFALILVFSVQSPIFWVRYQEYIKPSDNHGILAGKIAVLDWIYENSGGEGFNVYSHTQSSFDYAYQYLFWWYGKGEHGFVPCGYSNYPDSLKHLYVPNYLLFSQPTLGCNRFRFLIIEPEPKAEEWLSKAAAGTNIVTETEIAGIRVQKRIVDEKEKE